MSVDPAFIGAGKVEGFELWRIEDFKPVKLPEITGKFYEGDSYILLATIKKNSSLVWNLHFWLGKDTSQDEAGTAAYKTVELDESLGGGPVQYREVQGSESVTFLSYFKKPINGKGGKGVEYIPGGVASGFTHVEKDVYPTRLLEVKGKKVARVKEVPLSTASLTQGDAYILDMGLSIYIFIGPSANRAEKLKATQLACQLDDDERSGRATVYRLEDDPKNETFWNTLGGYVDPSTLSPGLPDTDEGADFKKKLFKISDEGGEMSFTEIPADGKLTRDMLVSSDVFLLHSLETIFLWLGRQASASEKKEAMAYALKYMKQAGVPANTSVLKVPESVEPGSFIKEFVTWAPKQQASTKAKREEIAMNIDASSFANAQRRDRVEEDFVAFEEKLQIWRIENFKTVEESPELYGQFYSGDSYIILYTFKKTKTSKEEYIIYFWLGQNSSTDEKGTAALLTKDLDDKMGGSPVQCRVVEGKEPLHFRRLFKGKMIIHQGGVPSGFRKTGGAAESEAVKGDVSLYCVRGPTPLSTVAREVKPVGQAINSDDCFITLTPHEAFLFEGRQSTADERAMAESVVTVLAAGRSVVHVTEGAEPEAFWTALGGKCEYSSFHADDEPARDPRLFLTSTVTGKFDVEEIENFDQTDLSDDDVMLLDTYDEVFIWVGGNATLEEEQLSKEFALKYIAAASKNDGRSLQTPTVRVQAGQEPFIFTRHFLNWDGDYREKNKYVDPYEAKLAQKQSQPKVESVLKDSVVKRDSLQHVETVERSFSRQGSLSTSATGTDEEKPKMYSLPSKQASTKQVSEAVAAVKGTYDTGKLPPMLAAKLEKPPTTPSAGASEREAITPDKYLTYEALKDNKGAGGVDVTRKEDYLSDADFVRLFIMDKAKFSTLPKWKKDDAKKKLGLF